MQLKAGMSRQPALDGGMLTGGVIVHHQVDVQLRRDVGFDLPQELEVFLMAMTRSAAGEDLAGGDVQGGKERGGAMADVIVGDPLHIAQAHGQQRLGAIQGLDLALSVHAEHHRFVGRIQVQAHDISDLLPEEGVGGELEVALAMGLKTKGPPDAMDGGPGKLGLLGQGADRPVGAIPWLGVQSLADQAGHLFIGNRPGPPGSQFIVQTREPLSQEAPAPFADRLGTEAHLP